MDNKDKIGNLLAKKIIKDYEKLPQSIGKIKIKYDSNITPRRYRKYSFTIWRFLRNCSTKNIKTKHSFYKFTFM